MMSLKDFRKKVRNNLIIYEKHNISEMGAMTLNEGKISQKYTFDPAYLKSYFSLF